MPERSYTLLDMDLPMPLWSNRDRLVRFMEYIRTNFNRIVSDVPLECEVDLIAGGHAHNHELVPMLGLWTPAESNDQLPSPSHMIDELSAWCCSLENDDIDSIIAKTSGPTWEQLLHDRIHPRRSS